MFKKILIANRGEIAVRVMRTCREMGIRTAAVYSDADRTALHVIAADEAYAIGPAPSAESYLNIPRILDAARRSGAEAIHPGYGFLSENPGFARAVEAAGMVFIGPPASAMERMGSKTASRRLAADAGLPVVPGATHNLESLDEVARLAEQIGYPVMLKASEGGGGKGLRLVHTPDELESAYRDARSEAQLAFGSPAVFVEKYLDRPRHVEIQVLGDRQGHLIYLGERECSLQRRHQKVMEECPSPALDEESRRKMGETAVRIAEIAGYSNTGTVEFLLDRDRHFHFLEMNTRLQVEHPVTELVYGVDLVREQIRIAAGEPLGLKQQDHRPRGWAIECRVYAEDPANHFFPSPGLITGLRTPSGPGVRDDSGVYEGWRVPLEYDPLLAKLIVAAEDRPRAIARLERALAEYDVQGIKTNLAFFRQLVEQPDFAAGKLDTGFIDRMLSAQSDLEEPASDEEMAAALLAATLFAARHHAPKSTLHTTRSEGNGRSAWKMAGRGTQLRAWPEKNR
jgi:acetyl-CoA carboxylase, biotin carboxylase subunit